MPFFYASEINNRTENQDYCCHMEQRLNHEALIETFLVADGMGGMADGGYYSRQAVNLWYEKLLKVILSKDFQGCSLIVQLDVLENFARKVYKEINKELYTYGLDHGKRGGTTLSAAIHFWDSWIFSNVGDSPIYYLEGKKLKSGCEIQNLAGKMLREKQVEEGSRLYYMNKNRLIEYLGKREEVNPYVSCVRDLEVSQVLMGSDGAFGNLKFSQLEEFVLSKRPGENYITSLFGAARESGETDNQTALLYIKESPVRESILSLGIEQNKDAVDSTLMMKSFIANVDESDYVKIEEKSPFQSLKNRFFHLKGEKDD